MSANRAKALQRKTGADTTANLNEYEKLADITIDEFKILIINKEHPDLPRTNKNPDFPRINRILKIHPDFVNYTNKEDLQYPGGSFVHICIKNADINMKSRIKLINILIEHGANLNIRNNDELTPLELAKEKGWLKIAKLLQQTTGANTTVDLSESKGVADIKIDEFKNLMINRADLEKIDQILKIHPE